MRGRAFPEGFLLGTATASFTNEGAWNEDGKGESIWDRFAHTPGKIVDGSTPEVACDHYHRYKEDIALMKELNLNAYSFSISWPRVYPTGFGEINGKGLDFYERLVDELLVQGIAPLATLYHWDLPQALEDMGGWPNPEIARYFADYASTCFERLGDRIKHWFTVNEPGVHASMGYLEGVHAPGRTSRDDMLAAGNTMLLAHGLAVERFRESGTGGGIGLIVNQATIHVENARETDAFHNRWFLDPIFFGRYPAELTLPELTHEERKIINQPVDFLGINYYSRITDQPTNERTAIGWEIYPEGLYEVLTMIRDRYGSVPLYVTENGAAFDDETDEDIERTAFIEAHLSQAMRAIRNGMDLRGFFVYTLMDNFECAFGNTAKFGIARTDFKTLERHVKSSGRWVAGVLGRDGNG